MPVNYLAKIDATRRLVDNLKLLLAKMALEIMEKDFSTDNFQFYLKTARNKYGKFRDTREITPFIQPTWLERLGEFDKYFLTEFDVDFLKHRVMTNMLIRGKPPFINGLLQFLQKCYDEKDLKSYLRENRVGTPHIINLHYLTSSTSITHLYHLALFESKTGVNLKNLSTVIEFGGGYGNIAKIFKRINPDATYVIIDLPVFTLLQYVYLSTILGDSIHLIEDKGATIAEGSINLVPLQSIDNLSTQKAQLFISTWGLSEASEYTQDYVYSHGFYGTSNILLGFQKNSKSWPCAENLVDLIGRQNFTYLEELHYSKDNYYGFVSS